ncbi:MAG: DUF3842 family protein [Spirochaetaceae bacterium]|jgi:D-arabinose 1-dehydrogenase-like Zn-dependent alcohol dehydrogenase|nr:DUF3842 family protein [Spirochaetaceae bacterium]
MKKKIVVIDGMGGGMGAQIIERLRAEAGKSLEIIALGTNAGATERMMKAGADKGATGENAVTVSASLGDFILGPVGIVIPDSMMGEITAPMAQAVLRAPGERILLPLQNDHFTLAGIEPRPLAAVIADAVELVKARR